MALGRANGPGVDTVRKRRYWTPKDAAVIIFELTGNAWLMVATCCPWDAARCEVLGVVRRFAALSEPSCATGDERAVTIL